MDLVGRARQLAESAGGGWLRVTEAKALAKEAGLAGDQLFA